MSVQIAALATRDHQRRQVLDLRRLPAGTKGNPLLQLTDRVEFPLLRHLQPGWDYLFNSFQMLGVIPELQAVVTDISPADQPVVHKFLEEALELAFRCQANCDTYLLLFGD